MRIVYIIETLERGGAEKQLALVANAMKMRGHAVSVIVLYAEGWWADDLRSSGIPVVHAKFPNEHKLRMKTWPAFRRLVQELRQQQPDIVCGFLYQGSIIAGLAAYQAGIQTILSVRRDCGFIRDQAPVPRFLEKLSHRVSTLYVANSHAVASALREEGVPLGKIRVIYNGIDMKETHVESKRAGDEFRVGILANLTPQKDHLTFVRAIGLACPHFPTLRAWIAGRNYGRHGEAIQAEIQRLKLSEHVRLLPPVGNSMEFISELDAGVLCSRTEGFPNVILEYMSQAKPVIASRVGGVPEVVRDGVTGILFPPGDADALARAILRLANDRPLCEQMGRAGLEVVGREFDINKIALEWEALYKEVASTGASKAAVVYG